MKIVKLEVENLKRVVKVDITPGGLMVLITGPNGAGKSSVLDAIWWALAGERSHQSAPIRTGEQTARIRWTCGDVVVTREFSAPHFIDDEQDALGGRGSDREPPRESRLESASRMRTVRAVHQPAEDARQPARVAHVRPARLQPGVRP